MVLETPMVVLSQAPSLKFSSVSVPDSLGVEKGLGADLCPHPLPSQVFLFALASSSFAIILSICSIYHWIKIRENRRLWAVKQRVEWQNIARNITRLYIKEYPKPVVCYMVHWKPQHKKHWEFVFLVGKVQEESLMHWKKKGKNYQIFSFSCK